MMTALIFVLGFVAGEIALAAVLCLFNAPRQERT